MTRRIPCLAFLVPVKSPMYALPWSLPPPRPPLPQQLLSLAVAHVEMFMRRHMCKFRWSDIDNILDLIDIGQIAYLLSEYIYMHHWRCTHASQMYHGEGGFFTCRRSSACEILNCDLWALAYVCGLQDLCSSVEIYLAV